MGSRNALPFDDMRISHGHGESTADSADNGNRIAGLHLQRLKLNLDGRRQWRHGRRAYMVRRLLRRHSARHRIALRGITGNNDDLLRTVGSRNTLRFVSMRIDRRHGQSTADGADNCKKYWAVGFCDFLKPSQTRADVIDAQLKKLGYTTDKVKAVITSHVHLDHGGNLALFPNAIHVVQRKELYQGWWPEKFQGRDAKGAFVLADLMGTRDFNFLELDGDYDLFGDGTVVVLSTPGHTLGHQSLKVKLASGKSVIMSQDAIWMQENLDGYVAGLNYSVKDWTNSVTRLKFIRDLEGAEIFMAHDQDQYAAKGGRWHK